ncbi:LysE family translocator [Fulvivirga lutea]|uniref:LysE family transporter n=1 Tax=Fulvivirga lutea TaxID=2810512 RepID=A0A974WIC2_9BACT|nr:LysE family transporter [Fulvivirga lutea]QSE99088.1 LysE family transporter [Fulvivirga lutea]
MDYIHPEFLMALLNGLIFGLTLAVMLGPVFFTLLQTSLEKGFSKAIIVAVGVSVGDIILILLAYFGLSKLIGFNENKMIIAYAGSVILALFGVASIIKARRPFNPKLNTTPEVKGFFRFFFKGLLINAISPFVPIFWIGTMSLATVEYNYSGTTLFAFFATIIAVVFLTDLLKAFLANKLSVLITSKVMRIMNILVGIILIAFSIRMATYYL